MLHACKNMAPTATVALTIKIVIGLVPTFIVITTAAHVVQCKPVRQPLSSSAKLRHKPMLHACKNMAPTATDALTIKIVIGLVAIFMVKVLA
jgi:hypothetical protein